MEPLFLELKRYVGFTTTDEERLRALGPFISGHIDLIVEAFYARILEHPEARAALERGEHRVGQLKVTLVVWMKELFLGPWDDTYAERRARIGTTHVRIGLPQHYMVTAMNLVRGRLLELLVDPHEEADRLAVQRLLDLDLAIMLHTYRLDLEARQVRAERLATFGQLVGSIGHELRNPLGVIETSLYVLKSRNDPDPRLNKHLDRIAGQVTIANDIIGQLLDLIRDRPLGRVPVDLRAILSEVESAVPRPPGVKVELPPADAVITASGDPVQLRQVFMNLVENAVYAASPEGTVRVGSRQVGPSLELSVEDSGKGIDPTIASRLFEPLVTTKPKGIGLGLALVKRIVDRHGGLISVTRGDLGGARFLVRLP